MLDLMLPLPELSPVSGKTIVAKFDGGLLSSDGGILALREVEVLKFGPVIAKNLREARPRAHSRWHLDEMVISIVGGRMYMWRAVDSEGEVLEILVQPRRDRAAALRLIRKLIRRQAFAPAVIITDKLRSYGAALREIGFSGLHEQGLRANNRTENSHRPVRRRERTMQGSNPPNRLSALFLSTRPFTTRSTSNGIWSVVQRIDSFGPQR